MKWTTEPPSKDGWYWAREFLSKTKIIVKVKNDNGNVFIMDGYVHVNAAFFQGEWAGPIPEPEEREND